jgi:hypothetical protein
VAVAVVTVVLVPEAAGKVVVTLMGAVVVVVKVVGVVAGVVVITMDSLCSETVRLRSFSLSEPSMSKELFSL